MRTMIWLAFLSLAAAAVLQGQTPDPGTELAKLDPAPVETGEKAAPAQGAGVVLCLDASKAVPSVLLGGRRFDGMGRPEPISFENLLNVGEHEGIPIYVSRLDSEPYINLWLPVCSPPDFYRLYTTPVQTGR